MERNSTRKGRRHRQKRHYSHPLLINSEIEDGWNSQLKRNAKKEKIMKHYKHVRQQQELPRGGGDPQQEEDVARGLEIQFYAKSSAARRIGDHFQNGAGGIHNHIKERKEELICKETIPR